MTWLAMLCLFGLGAFLPNAVADARDYVIRRDRMTTTDRAIALLGSGLDALIIAGLVLQIVAGWRP